VPLSKQYHNQHSDALETWKHRNWLARGVVYVFISELRSDWLPNGPLEANAQTLSKRPAETLCFAHDFSLPTIKDYIHSCMYF